VIPKDDAFELENRTIVPRLMAKRMGRLIDSKHVTEARALCFSAMESASSDATLDLNIGL
jgi:hypothetical protein